MVVKLLLLLELLLEVVVTVVLIFHRCPLVVVRRGQRCEILTHFEDAFDGEVALGKQFRSGTRCAGAIEGGIQMSLLVLVLLLLELKLVVRKVIVEAGGGIWRFTATRGRGGRRTGTSTFPFDDFGQEVERTGGTALSTDLGKMGCGRVVRPGYRRRGRTRCRWRRSQVVVFHQLIEQRSVRHLAGLLVQTVPNDVVQQRSVRTGSVVYAFGKFSRSFGSARAGVVHGRSLRTLRILKPLHHR